MPRPPQNRPPPLRSQQNYLSGNTPGQVLNKTSHNNRKRKKDIVPPVEPLTEDPVARAPLDEGERQEIEAWKAERRKHWPTDANVSKKQRNTNDGGDDTRQITLGDVLETQERLGLLRKAGTEDLVKHLHRKDGGSRGMEAVDRKLANRKAQGALSGRGTGPRRQNTQRRKTLLERLLEKDMKSEEAKVVQLFHFIHMNGYLRGKEEEELVLRPTVRAKQRAGRAAEDVEDVEDVEDDGDVEDVEDVEDSVQVPR